MNSNLLRQKAIEWPLGGQTDGRRNGRAPYNSAPFPAGFAYFAADSGDRRQGGKEGGREGGV